jgi:hypothetical protein
MQGLGRIVGCRPHETSCFGLVYVYNRLNTICWRTRNDDIKRSNYWLIGLSIRRQMRPTAADAARATSNVYIPLCPGQGRTSHFSVSWLTEARPIIPITEYPTVTTSRFVLWLLLMLYIGLCHHILATTLSTGGKRNHDKMIHRCLYQDIFLLILWNQCYSLNHIKKLNVKGFLLAKTTISWRRFMLGLEGR